MGMFKGGLKGKGSVTVNNVIIDEITKINNSCNYMQLFFNYKYNVCTQKVHCILMIN